LVTVAGLGRGLRPLASGARGGFVAGAGLARGALATTAGRLAATAAAVRSGTAPGITTIFRRSMMSSRRFGLDGVVDVVFGRSYTRIGADRLSTAVANHVRPLDGYHDVIVHGSPDSFIPLGSAQLVSPAQVADTVLANPNYVPGTPVRVMSCWTGRNGESGPAQQVADHLHVEVLAPTVKAGVAASVGVQNAVLGVANRVVAPGTVVQLANGKEVVAEWVRLAPRSRPDDPL
nr:hypothetical protein [Micromonospora sp. DSM 115978]